MSLIRLVWVDLLFGALWPALFGYFHLPYWTILVLSGYFGGRFLWKTRGAVAESRRLAFADGHAPPAYIHFVTILLWIAISVCFLAPQTAIYFFFVWIGGP